MQEMGQVLSPEARAQIQRNDQDIDRQDVSLGSDGCAARPTPLSYWGWLQEEQSFPTIEQDEMSMIAREQCLWPSCKVSHNKQKQLYGY